jgi:lipopolysaccharide transport system ATP-binding protein
MKYSVKVEGVSKKFCRDLKRSLWYGVKDISSELFGSKKNGQLRPKEFWAVDDVSFELKRGECLGLIGHNGAGKSTLLKMLNGLIKPDKGTITMHGPHRSPDRAGGRLQPHPHWTGKTSTTTAQCWASAKRRSMPSLIAIVEFAEIGDFIDTPRTKLQQRHEGTAGFCSSFADGAGCIADR